MRALLALATLAAVAAALALAQQSNGPQPTGPLAQRTPAPTPARTPPPPRLSRGQIDRQDRTGRSQREREARVFDTRPLLQRLPLQRHGVRLDIAGLAPDDRRTVLSIDPRGRSRTLSRRIYRALLRATGDRGSSYVLEWAK